MIDSHCHLDFDVFDDDLTHVIERAGEQGVSRFLVPGTTPNGWQKQLQVAERFEHVDIAFGLHPYFPDFLTNSNVDKLQVMLDTHRESVCAVGEIGLDKTVDMPLSQQEDIFSRQLELAQTCELPVILHHRKTHHLLIKHLKACNFSFGGVIHAFSGSKQIAQEYIDMGFCLGIGGTITYERAHKTREAVKTLPLSAMLLETDSPDMPLCGYQGQRNTPIKIPQVAESLAHLLDTDVETVGHQTDANYRRLFLSSDSGRDCPSA